MVGQISVFDFMPDFAEPEPDPDEKQDEAIKDSEDTVIWGRKRKTKNNPWSFDYRKWWHEEATDEDKKIILGA